MKKIVTLTVFFTVSSVLLFFNSSLRAEIKEIKAEDLIGKETLNFYLASYDDRLVHYGNDYYGKYTLIMTFFPAAFTPV